MAEAESVVGALTQRVVVSYSVRDTRRGSRLVAETAIHCPVSQKEEARLSGLKTDVELEREARHELQQALDVQAGAAAHAVALESALRERLPELRALVDAMASEARSLSQRLIAAPDAARAEAAAKRASNLEEQCVLRDIARNRRERALLGRVDEASAAAADAERSVEELRGRSKHAALATADELRPELAALRGSIAALEGDSDEAVEIDAFQALVRRAEEAAAAAVRAAESAEADAAVLVRGAVAEQRATLAERDALARALARVRAMRPRDAAALVAARLRALTAPALPQAPSSGPSERYGAGAGVARSRSPLARSAAGVAGASAATTDTPRGASASTTTGSTASPPPGQARVSPGRGSPLTSSGASAPVDDLAVALDAIYGPIPVPPPPPAAPAASSPKGVSPGPPTVPRAANTASPQPAASSRRTVGSASPGGRRRSSASPAVWVPGVAGSELDARPTSSAGAAPASPSAAKPAWIAKALSIFAEPRRAGGSALAATLSLADAAMPPPPPPRPSAESGGSSSANAVDAVEARMRTAREQRSSAAHEAGGHDARSGDGAWVDGTMRSSLPRQSESQSRSSGRSADHADAGATDRRVPRYMRPRSVDSMRAAAAREAAAVAALRASHRSTDSRPPPTRPTRVKAVVNSGDATTAQATDRPRLQRRQSDVGEFNRRFVGDAYDDHFDSAAKANVRRGSLDGRRALRQQSRASADSLLSRRHVGQRHVSFLSPTAAEQEAGPQRATGAGGSAVSRSPHRDTDAAAADARRLSHAVAALLSPSSMGVAPRRNAVTARNAPTPFPTRARTRHAIDNAIHALRDSSLGGWDDEASDDVDGNRVDAADDRRAFSADVNPLVALATMSASVSSDDGFDGHEPASAAIDSSFVTSLDGGSASRGDVPPGTVPSSADPARQLMATYGEVPSSAPISSAVSRLPPSPELSPQHWKQQQGGKRGTSADASPHRSPARSERRLLIEQRSPSEIVAAFLKAATAAATAAGAQDFQSAASTSAADAVADITAVPREDTDVAAHSPAGEAQEQSKHDESSPESSPQPASSHSLWNSVFQGGRGTGRGGERRDVSPPRRGMDGADMRGATLDRTRRDGHPPQEPALFEAALLSPPSDEKRNISGGAMQKRASVSRVATAPHASLERLSELSRPRQPLAVRPTLEGKGNGGRSEAPLLRREQQHEQRQDTSRRRSPPQPAPNSYSLRWRQQQQQQHAAEVASALIAAAADTEGAAW